MFRKFHRKTSVLESFFYKERPEDLKTLLKKDSNTCVFLWNLWNFWKHFLLKEHHHSSEEREVWIVFNV